VLDSNSDIQEAELCWIVIVILVVDDLLFVWLFYEKSQNGGESFDVKLFTNFFSCL
jgi:hypothetical protein